MVQFLRPYGGKRLLTSPSDYVFKSLLCYCVFKKLLCLNKSKITLSFVDDAKVETKKKATEVIFHRRLVIESFLRSFAFF